MTDRQIAAAIREVFPKHSNAAYSLAKNGPETGVRLTPEAQRIADGVKGVSKPHRDTHKKQHRLQVRVTKERYKTVKRLIEEDGRFPTVNAWLDWWVYVWVAQKEKAASVAGTTEDGKTKHSLNMVTPYEEKINDEIEICKEE